MVLGSTQPLKEMSTTNIISWWGKGGRCVGLTTLPPCAEWLEIWGPQPTGTLRDYFTLLRNERARRMVKFTNRYFNHSCQRTFQHTVTSRATCTNPITTLILFTEFKHACQVRHFTTKREAVLISCFGAKLRVLRNFRRHSASHTRRTAYISLFCIIPLRWLTVTHVKQRISSKCLVHVSN